MCVCFMTIITCVPACVYSEPLKDMILCVYLATKGQTVTDGPVLQRKSSMLLFDVVIAVRFRLVSLKERPFTLPIRPQRALPSQGALSTVSCCLHHSSRYVSAPLRRRPPPHALPVWGCGRWPSPPFPSCFRPTRLFPSRETLCFCGCVNLTLRGRVRLARLQC